MSMRTLIKKSVNKANASLADREADLLKNTDFTESLLSPNIREHHLYSSLIDVIRSATAANMNAAKLESNIRELGDEAWQLTQRILNAVK